MDSWMSGLLTNAVQRPVRSGIHHSSKAESVAADTVSPVIKKVSKRLVEGDPGLPFGRPVELGAVRPQDRHVGRPEPRRVLLGADLDARLREQHVQHLADGPGAPAADVVYLARLAALERQPVRADHVADVGPVALAGEIAVVNHRLVLAGLDQRDLPREGARREVRAAPRTGVVERAGNYQVQAVGLEVLVSKLVLSHLADRVGRQRP